MKNVAKIEIVLHDPYSNALWGGGGGKTQFYFMTLLVHFKIIQYINIPLRGEGG